MSQNSTLDSGPRAGAPVPVVDSECRHGQWMLGEWAQECSMLAEASEVALRWRSAVPTVDPEDLAVFAVVPVDEVGAGGVPNLSV